MSSSENRREVKFNLSLNCIQTRSNHLFRLTWQKREVPTLGLLILQEKNIMSAPVGQLIVYSNHPCTSSTTVYCTQQSSTHFVSDPRTLLTRPHSPRQLMRRQRHRDHLALLHVLRHAHVPPARRTQHARALAQAHVAVDRPAAGHAAASAAGGDAHGLRVQCERVAVSRVGWV